MYSSGPRSIYDAEILSSDCAMLLTRPNDMNIENVEERPSSKNDLGCVTNSVIAVRENLCPYQEDLDKYFFEMLTRISLKVNVQCLTYVQMDSCERHCARNQNALNTGHNKQLLIKAIALQKNNFMETSVMKVLKK
uniref:Uncharacterized protein n=1 Tax=Glossina pallidipes TaxID=7398 RepID=A0A1A9ZU51_GLOPL